MFNPLRGERVVRGEHVPEYGGRCDDGDDEGEGEAHYVHYGVELEAGEDGLD